VEACLTRILHHLKEKQIDEPPSFVNDTLQEPLEVMQGRPVSSHWNKGQERIPQVVMEKINVDRLFAARYTQIH
jgi:hypothetical protein